MKNLNNYLAEGSVIEGRLFIKDTVTINGIVIGSIESDQEVIFESKGKMEGPIRANIIKVKGQINGDVNSRSKLEILPGGQLNGKITIPNGGLIVKKGGMMNSKLSVTKSENPTRLIPSYKSK